MAFKYEIRTDAGYKDNTSTHYYRIRSQGKTLKSKRFNSLSSSAIEAEALSIITALQYAVERDLRGVIIKTDCLNLTRLVNDRSINIDKFIKSNERKSGVNVEMLKRDIVHLRKMKDAIKAQMRHVPRSHNHIADRECKRAKIDKKISGFRFRKYSRYGLAES